MNQVSKQSTAHMRVRKEYHNVAARVNHQTKRGHHAHYGHTHHGQYGHHIHGHQRHQRRIHGHQHHQGHHGLQGNHDHHGNGSKHVHHDHGGKSKQVSKERPSEPLREVKVTAHRLKSENRSDAVAEQLQAEVKQARNRPSRMHLAEALAPSVPRDRPKLPLSGSKPSQKPHRAVQPAIPKEFHSENDHELHLSPMELRALKVEDMDEPEVIPESALKAMPLPTAREGPSQWEADARSQHLPNKQKEVLKLSHAALHRSRWHLWEAKIPGVNATKAEAGDQVRKAPHENHEVTLSHAAVRQSRWHLWEARPPAQNQTVKTSQEAKAKIPVRSNTKSLFTEYLRRLHSKELIKTSNQSTQRVGAEESHGAAISHPLTISSVETVSDVSNMNFVPLPMGSQKLAEAPSKRSGEAQSRHFNRHHWATKKKEFGTRPRWQTQLRTTFPKDEGEANVHARPRWQTRLWTRFPKLKGEANAGNKTAHVRNFHAILHQSRTAVKASVEAHVPAHRKTEYHQQLRGKHGDRHSTLMAELPTSSFGLQSK